MTLNVDLLMQEVAMWPYVRPSMALGQRYVRVLKHYLQRIIDAPPGDSWVSRHDAYWFLVEFIEEVVCDTNVRYRNEMGYRNTETKRDYFDRNLKA